MYPEKAWSTRKRKAASAAPTPFCLHILVPADVLRTPSARHRALTDPNRVRGLVYTDVKD